MQKKQLIPENDVIDMNISVVDASVNAKVFLPKEKNLKSTKETT